MALTKKQNELLTKLYGHDDAKDPSWPDKKVFDEWKKRGGVLRGRDICTRMLGQNTYQFRCQVYRLLERTGRDSMP